MRMSTREVEHRNEVVLVGRLTGPPETRDLPSGDEITVWRVTVDRPPRRRGGEKQPQPGHDTVECTAWSPRVQRSAAAWQRDDVIEVSGPLRRRFWQAPTGGRQSSYTVEVLRAKRLTIAPAPAARPPARRPRKPG
jgi:single-strand DNA-binding protein